MSFARSLATVSGLTLVSRIGGFIRDSLTAVFLGAGPVADAFFVAQRLPNLFRSLFAEGAFSAAFVPIYTQERELQGEDAAQRFAGQALMLLLAALIPFSVLIMLGMPYVMPLIATGFAPGSEKFMLATRFSTITFPYLALISITALQTGVLNAHGRFGPGAAAPIALNIVLILGLLAAHVLGWQIGYTLAWAVTVSGVVQCLWLAISCRRAGLSIPLLRPQLGAASRQLFARVGPGAIGAGMYQVNLLISQNFASMLPTGAISYLFYADRLNQLPYGIIGIAIATTLLPTLSRHIARGEEDQARHYTARGIEFCLLLGLPAMIGLIVLARPIIQMLFQHGAFTHEDTVQTARALRAYALGIPGFLLVKVFAASFFARHDTKTPVRIALLTLVLNVICAWLWLTPLGHAGIALASSLAVSANAALLFWHMRRRGFSVTAPGLSVRLGRILLSALVMSIVTIAALIFFWDYLPRDNSAAESFYFVCLLIMPTITYAAALQLTGAMKWREALAILQRKPVQ